MIVLHLLTKSEANTFIHYEDIDVLRNSTWPPSAILDLIETTVKAHCTAYPLQKIVTTDLVVIKLQGCECLLFSLESPIYAPNYYFLEDMITKI